MESGGQPIAQTGLGGRQVHTGHADLGKSQLTAPSLDLRDELKPIEHDRPIVGSPWPKAHWHARTEADTAALAQALAHGLAQPAVRGDAVVALQGDLGAGKTTLVRHLLRALGVMGRIKSPTYAVVEPHQTPAAVAWPQGLAVSHFDFYRFSDPREWEDAGLRELFTEPGLKLVEWPQNAPGLWPVTDLEVTLQALDEQARLVSLVAHSATGAHMISAMQAALPQTLPTPTTHHP